MVRNRRVTSKWTFKMLQEANKTLWVSLTGKNWKTSVCGFKLFYSLFHKTLPKSSLLMHWFSVRFYDMGDWSNMKKLVWYQKDSFITHNRKVFFYLYEVFFLLPSNPPIPSKLKTCPSLGEYRGKGGTSPLCPLLRTPLWICLIVQFTNFGWNLILKTLQMLVP